MSDYRRCAECHRDLPVTHFAAEKTLEILRRLGAGEDRSAIALAVGVHRTRVGQVAIGDGMASRCRNCRSAALPAASTSGDSVNDAELEHLSVERFRRFVPGWHPTLPSEWLIPTDRKRVVGFSAWHLSGVGYVFSEEPTEAGRWYGARDARIEGRAVVFTGKVGPFERIGEAMEAMGAACT